MKVGLVIVALLALPAIALAYPPATVEDVTENSVTLGGLDCGTQYQFQITEAGGSPTTQSVTTDACPAPLPPVAGNIVGTGDSSDGTVEYPNPVTLAHQGADCRGVDCTYTWTAAPIGPGTTPITWSEPGAQTSRVLPADRYSVTSCVVNVTGQDCRTAPNQTLTITVTAPPPPPAGVTCTKSVSPGVSASSAFSGVASGGVVCLKAGGYSWGNFSIPNGVTLSGDPDAGFATVNGEPSTENRTGAKITDLYLVNTGTHAVLNLRGTNNTAQYLNVDGGRKTSLFQGVLMSGAGNRITDTVIHDVGTYPSTYGTRNHGIYYAGGENGLIDRVWTYRISGYGFHFYGGSSITGTVLDHSVVDDGLSGRSIVKDISGGLTIRNTVATDSGAVRCLVQPVTVTNSRSDSGGCGFTTGDTAYANEAGRDYGNSTSGFFTPGPRW